MEAQLQPPRSHGDPRHEEDPHHAGLHSVAEGEGEHDQHGEKKSVLKKVKEKAKKIKHTITKHGHEHGQGHGHEHDYRHDQISEEDDDDEIETDRGIHGARAHEHTVITGTNLPKQTEVDLENPADHKLEKRQPNVHGSSGLHNPNWDNPAMGAGGLGASTLENPNVDNPPFTGAGAHRQSGLQNPNVETPILGTGAHATGGQHNSGIDTFNTGSGAHRSSGIHNPIDLGTRAQRSSGLHSPNVGAPILGTGAHTVFGQHNPDFDTSNTGAGAHKSSGMHSSNVGIPSVGTGVHKPSGLDNPNVGAGVHEPSDLHNPYADTHNIGYDVHKPSGTSMAAESGLSAPFMGVGSAGSPLTGTHDKGAGLDNPNVGAGVHKPSDLHNPYVDTPNIGSNVHKPSGTTMAAESGLSAPFMAVGSAGRPLTGTHDKGANAKIGQYERLEEDPHSPSNSPLGSSPSNYQAKVADPTGKGGKEADVAPLARRFDDMHVHDGSKLEPVPESTHPYTGTHDQFAPHGSPTAKQFKPGSSPDDESLGPMPTDTIAGKASSAASVIANKAAAAKNMVASKLGYGDDQGHEDRDMTPGGTEGRLSEPSKTPITTPVDTTAGKVSVATSALADKAAAAKDMVASKLGYGDQGGHDTVTDITPNRGVSETVTGKVSSAASVLADKAAAAKNQVASKLGYSNQGHPTEDYNKGASDAGHIHDTTDTTSGKASSATSTLADKAAAAKNMVASKLGYGDQGHPAHDYNKGPSDAGHIHDSTDTTAGKPSSVTSALADKAAAAKNMVASKLRYSDQGHSPVKSPVPGETDKGMSVKEYLAEKLRPGDDEKALSSAITDKLHRKEGTREDAAIGKEGTTEGAPMKRASVITETVHKNKEEGPVLGKVTVSKEVAEMLGPKHENKREGVDAMESGMENTGGSGGMVDRLKGAVGSWLGKSSGMETAKNSVKQAHVSDAGDAQGRRLQESGN